MYSTPDAQLALSSAQNNDLTQRKRQMDALHGRLGDQRDKAQKLREACEGFESIFLQKMWEQMRATVPDDGYLHSKEEKFWQSMFDQELAKKMASAGGIGLGDMLFDQLSVTLLDVSRVSAPGKVDQTAPLRPLHPAQQHPEPLSPLTPLPIMAPSTKDIYTPLDEARITVNEPDTFGGLYDLASAVAAFSINDAVAAEAATEAEFPAPVIIPANPAALQPVETTVAPTGPPAVAEAAARQASLSEDGSHEAIMRRLAEIARAARAPQSDIDLLSGRAATTNQAKTAGLSADETAAAIPAEPADRFTASRLGNPERARSPQHNPVPDAPIVQRAANSTSGPRMQHPSARRREPMPEI